MAVKSIAMKTRNVNSFTISQQKITVCGTKLVKEPENHRMKAQHMLKKIIEVLLLLSIYTKH